MDDSKRDLKTQIRLDEVHIANHVFDHIMNDIVLEVGQDPTHLGMAMYFEYLGDFCEKMGMVGTATLYKAVALGIKEADEAFHNQNELWPH